MDKLDKVLLKYSPKKWFFGHFHLPMSRLPSAQCLYITVDSEGETDGFSDFLFERMFDKDLL